MFEQEVSHQQAGKQPSGNSGVSPVFPEHQEQHRSKQSHRAHFGEVIEQQHQEVHNAAGQLVMQEVKYRHVKYCYMIPKNTVFPTTKDRSLYKKLLISERQAELCISIRP